MYAAHTGELLKANPIRRPQVSLTWESRAPGPHPLMLFKKLIYFCCAGSLLLGRLFCSLRVTLQWRRAGPLIAVTPLAEYGL